MRTLIVTTFLLLALPAAASAQLTGENLLVNPGAETGMGATNTTDVFPPAGWEPEFGAAHTAVRYGSGDFPGPIERAGANFFAGGPADGQPQHAEQDVDVTFAASEIAAGAARATLSALLGGRADDAAAARVTATFHATSGAEVGRLVLGPVTPADRGGVTGLLARAESAVLPTATRRIHVRIDFLPSGLGYLHAYADEVRLTLTGAGSPTPTPVGPEPTATVPPFPVPPPLPPAPTAAFAVVDHAAKVNRGVWLDATPSAASTTSSLRYEWDFDGNGSYEWSCDGGAGAVTKAYATAGTKTVTLKVTDEHGQVDVESRAVEVDRSEVNTLAKAGSAGEVVTCEVPRTSTPDDLDCVTAFGFGVVEVVAREGCFDLETRSTAERRRAGGPSTCLCEVVRASIRGPVALNGVLVPLPSRLKSTYDSGAGTIDLGRSSVRFGPIPSQEVLIAKRVATPLGGRFEMGAVKLSAGQSLGGLPLQAGAVWTLFGNRRSELVFSVGLPNVFTVGAGQPAQGAVKVLVDNHSQWRIDGVRVGPVPYLRLGPLEVRDLSFDYDASLDRWQGGAKVALTPGGLALDAAAPPEDQGFGLLHGRFDHAGAGLEIQHPPYPELFPGVGLKRIGGAFGVAPVRLTGDVGLVVGQGLVEIDGTLRAIFATPDEPFTLPGAGRLDAFTLLAEGQANLVVPLFRKLSLAKASAVYQHPDFFGLEAGFSFSEGFEVGRFSIEGKVGGFVALQRRQFSFEGGVRGCLEVWKIDACLGVGAVVSSRGIGFCALFPTPVPGVQVPAGVGYTWGSSSPDFMVFSCDYGPYREARPAQAGAADDVVLPEGLPAAALRIRGRDGAPGVVVTGPKGERFEVGVDVGEAGDGTFAAVRAGTTTHVWLRRPAGGRWRVASLPGSAPVVAVDTSVALPEPRVRARVERAGAARVLTYAFARQPGLRVTFSEQGTRTARVLGTASRGGRLRFTPGAGGRERRRIVATVERNGVPLRSTTVARFTTSGRVRLAAPARVRAARAGGAVVTVRWRRVPGAAAYGVTLRSADGRQTYVVVRRPRARLALPALGRGRVEVVAQAADGRLGRSVSATVRAR